MITRKDIALCVVLSIITCGIYGIVWFINITDDTGRISGDSRLSGVRCFLLTIITCGIYGFYWAYIMGQALYRVKAERYMPDNNDNSILYLLLTVLGLGIVTYCLIQDELNRIADKAVY